MDLPDESQWDETTCDLAICQHPQCWATIRRIERGHPRILGSPCKIPLDINDKLPMLTVVNISNSCFQAKRHPHHHFSGFSFTKPHSLMSQRSKFDSKFQGRYETKFWKEETMTFPFEPWKDLPDKDFPNRSSKVSHRLKKLPVLNLNETQLPCPQDANHMVVIWIPKESEEHVGPAEKYTVPSQDGKKKRKKSTVKDKSSLLFPGKQDIETRLRAPGIVVPPGSPVHLFEQQISKFLPFSNQSDTLPQDLLSDLLSAEGKTTPCPEMKTQLAMLKKKPPLEKSPPDSAISAKMLLSVHHLNLQGGSRGLRARCLQTPALRYPDYSKRFYYSLKLEGQRKQQQQRQQQRKLKTSAKKQGTKRKSKSGPGSQSTPHKRLGAMVCDPCHGHRTLPGQEDDKKQEQQKQQKKKVAPLKQDSTERPQTAYAQSDLDSFPNATLSKTETTNEDEVVLGAQEKTPKDLSASTPRTSRNPEPKRLQTLQSTDHEGEENQLSGAQREESLEEEAEGITGAALVHSRCLGI